MEVRYKEEQSSKAKMQQDMDALKMFYESKLADVDSKPKGKLLYGSQIVGVQNIVWHLYLDVLSLQILSNFEIRLDVTTSRLCTSDE